MKTLRICKSTVSMILALIMLVSMCTVAFVNTAAAETDTVSTAAEVDTATTSADITGGTRLYFKPDSNWQGDNAWFAAYFYKGSNDAWVRATLYMDNIYYVDAPAGTWTTLIWVRMNPDIKDTNNNNLNWDNKWNQTGNLSYDGVNNLYSVPSDDPWGQPGDKTNDKSNWTVYTFFDSGEAIYFTEQSNSITWDDDGAWFAGYFYNGTGNEYAPEKNTWVKAYACPFDGGYYKLIVPQYEGKDIQWDRLIIVRQNPTYSDMVFDYDSDPKKTWGQTTNMWNSADTNKCFEINKTVDGKYDGTWIAFTENAGLEPSGETKTIYLRDDTGSSNNDYNYWLDNDDANIFACTNVKDDKGNPTMVQMDQTIDTLSGHTMWTAKVDTAATKIVFYRASYYYDESNASTTNWNTWSADMDAAATKFFVGTDGTGKWNASNSVRAADSSDKYNYWYGIWVDSTEETNANTKHFVKWYEESKANLEYSLYLPSYVDLNSTKVYTSFYRATITGGVYGTTGKTLYQNAPNTLILDPSVQYTITAYVSESDFNASNTKVFTLNVYHTEDTAAMLMTTNEDLWVGTLNGAGTDTDAGLSVSKAWPDGTDANTFDYIGEYKELAETKGTYYMYDESGSLINDTEKTQVLKKIKGRGNSSYEASARVYGKYAYNLTSDKKVELIDGAATAKKWSLLANNVDSTMLRNTLIYSIADDIGIKYVPKTRVIDLYDNGNYLGCYILAEKVEYGEDTLMSDMINLDKVNEAYNASIHSDFDTDNCILKEKTYTTSGGTTYTYRCATTYTTEYSDEPVAFETPENFKECNFLLEHELFDRYTTEASYFISGRTKQAVVVKYPEYATEEEMLWIIDLYEQAESAVYEGTYDDIDAILDVDSFARMYLIQELALNLDAGATSYYIHNNVYTDDNGELQSELVTSPVWDYDWAAGSYVYDSDSTGGKAGECKYTYNGSTVSGDVNVADPEQMFVNVKALKTGPKDTVHEKDYDNYNFQAMLCQNDTFWALCQNIWTNEMVAVLEEHLDTDTDADGGADDGILLTEMMPAFTSAALMNDARWNSVAGNDNDDWGTKDSDDYERGTMTFNVTDHTSSGGADSSYENTVYYLNDWLVTRMNYMSDEGDLTTDKYVIEGVDFTYELDETTGELSVTPEYATAAHGDTDLAQEELTYSVYVDGKCVVENYSFDDVPAVVTLSAGSHDVYVTVSPVAYSSMAVESDAQRITYIAAGGVVDMTIYFKSSDSYRYVPSVIVGSTSYEMEKVELLGYNASYTQGYYWYKTTVPATLGGTVDLTFTNLTGMSAHISVSNVQYQGYYFGADNLNNADTAVDLTDSSETVRNFYKSATYMLTNDVTVAGLAMTSLDGTSYVLGDTDSDDTLSILDATTIQLALVEKIELDNTQSALADYDLDEETSILDVTSIQTYLVNN